MKFKDKKDVEFKTSRIRRAYVTDSKLTYFEKHYRENIDLNDYEKIYDKECIQGLSKKLQTL